MSFSSSVAIARVFLPACESLPVFHSEGGLGDTPVFTAPEPAIFCALSQCSWTLPFWMRRTSKLLEWYVFDGSRGSFDSVSKISQTIVALRALHHGLVRELTGIGILGLAAIC